MFQERWAMTKATELLRKPTNVIDLEDLDYGRPLRANARHTITTLCRLGGLGGFAEDVRQLVVGFGEDGGGGEKGFRFSLKRVLARQLACQRIHFSLKRAQDGVGMQTDHSCNIKQAIRRPWLACMVIKGGRSRPNHPVVLLVLAGPLILLLWTSMVCFCLSLMFS